MQGAQVQSLIKQLKIPRAAHYGQKKHKASWLFLVRKSMLSAGEKKKSELCNNTSLYRYNQFGTWMFLQTFSEPRLTHFSEQR